MSSRFRRCTIIHSPSLILLGWAILLAFDKTSSSAVRVVLMVALAVAFVAEERVKWRGHCRRRPKT